VGLGVLTNAPAGQIVRHDTHIRYLPCWFNQIFSSNLNAGVMAHSICPVILRA
jgi:hypothetical protein